MRSLQRVVIGRHSDDFIVNDFSRFPFIGVCRNFRQYRRGGTVDFLLHIRKLGHFAVIFKIYQTAPHIVLSRVGLNRADAIHDAGNPEAADIQIRPVEPHLIFHIDRRLHIADGFQNLPFRFVPPFQILSEVHHPDAGRRFVALRSPGRSIRCVAVRGRSGGLSGAAGGRADRKDEHKSYQQTHKTVSDFFGFPRCGSVSLPVLRHRRRSSHLFFVPSFC